MSNTKTLAIAASALFCFAPLAAAQTASPATSAPVANAAEAVQRTPDTISRAAAVYGTYQTDVGDIKSTPLGSAGDIDEALTELGTQNSEALSKGWLAYSALVASQDPEFRAAVRDIEGFYGRDRVLLGFRNDIKYARTLEGGSGAVGAAMTALDADGRRIDNAAAYVKEQAYSLQSVGWAKARFNDSAGRANSIGTAARAGREADAGLVQALSSVEADQALTVAGSSGAPSLWDGLTAAANTVRFPTLSGTFGGSRKSIKSGQEPVADRIATLAAYRVMGIDGAAAAQVQAALSDRASSRCLQTANLNLQQCVAASYKQYEVPFCLGEHALADVGECIDAVVQ